MVYIDAKVFAGKSAVLVCGDDRYAYEPFFASNRCIANTDAANGPMVKLLWRTGFVTAYVDRKMLRKVPEWIGCEE